MVESNLIKKDKFQNGLEEEESKMKEKEEEMLLRENVTKRGIKSMNNRIFSAWLPCKLRDSLLIKIVLDFKKLEF